MVSSFRKTDKQFCIETIIYIRLWFVVSLELALEFGRGACLYGSCNKYLSLSGQVRRPNLECVLQEINFFARKVLL